MKDEARKYLRELIRNVEVGVKNLDGLYAHRRNYTDLNFGQLVAEQVNQLSMAAQVAKRYGLKRSPATKEHHGK